VVLFTRPIRAPSRWSSASIRVSSATALICRPPIRPATGSAGLLCAVIGQMHSRQVRQPSVVGIQPTARSAGLLHSRWIRPAVPGQDPPSQLSDLPSQALVRICTIRSTQPALVLRSASVVRTHPRLQPTWLGSASALPSSLVHCAMVLRCYCCFGTVIWVLDKGSSPLFTLLCGLYFGMSSCQSMPS
jgi:hypothetical protein